MSSRRSRDNFPAPGAKPPFVRRMPVFLWLILLPPLIFSVYLETSALKSVEYHGHFGHGLVEGFCGLMAIIVGFAVWRECTKTGSCALLATALGSTAMGIVDLFHALSRPGSDEFVWLHSTSVFLGSLGFLSGAVASHTGPCRPATARRAMGVLWLSMVVFGAVSLIFPGLIPSMSVGGYFTGTAIGLNTLAAVFLLTAGLVQWRKAREAQNFLLYVYALGLFLFAESAGIFSLSRLWDSTWWLWHFVKVLVFLTVIVCGAHSFSEAFHEVKESRAALEQAYHDLKAAQESLVESEKLAALGEAAASLAHEIRNPLGVLHNAIGGLQQFQNLSTEDRELLDLMEVEVDRLNGIVTEFLRFARPRPLMLRHVLLPLLVEEVIREVERAVRPDVPLKVVSSLDGDIPACLFDPGEMKQALLNILTNAVQALPHGGRILIEGTRRNGRVEISVADTGEGIPEDVLASVFTPFFTTKAEGTGLGLSIARRIVRAHGGEIAISSQAGKGTTVLVTLPAPDLSE